MPTLSELPPLPSCVRPLDVSCVIGKTYSGTGMDTNEPLPSPDPFDLCLRYLAVFQKNKKLKP